jgi:hypothetical protein
MSSISRPPETEVEGLIKLSADSSTSKRSESPPYDGSLILTASSFPSVLTISSSSLKSDSKATLRSRETSPGPWRDKEPEMLSRTLGKARRKSKPSQYLKISPIQTSLNFEMKTASGDIEWKNSNVFMGPGISLNTPEKTRRNSKPSREDSILKMSPTTPSQPTMNFERQTVGVDPGLMNNNTLRGPETSINKSVKSRRKSELDHKSYIKTTPSQTEVNMEKETVSADLVMNATNINAMSDHVIDAAVMDTKSAEKDTFTNSLDSTDFQQAEKIISLPTLPHNAAKKKLREDVKHFYFPFFFKLKRVGLDFSEFIFKITHEGHVPKR